LIHGIKAFSIFLIFAISVPPSRADKPVIDLYKLQPTE
jgi:hypothetical protein